MNIKYEYSYNNLSVTDIELFESEYDINLPSAYKSFLLFNNGGKPKNRRFKTSDGKITSSVMLFLPISKEEDLNLGLFFEKYNQSEILPSNLIPIGIDPADSLICLDIYGEDKIFFCDMDYFEEDNELKDEYILLVSKHFSDFINSLQET
ncbi:SMI1/KNR4 family protein [Bacillus sp. N1-1]|uniref:SMI1/KNR4 family protein n=1 Tax=Bacillus sp. N1-1 TaxID=2682541 RepID=UPI001316101F|nr:SMI1/KNR4 family protein [Bacillus sp. N1-1]QHA91159.1 SMI1/KNR4 family protein [Bacillus sp. N1-1]